MSVVGFDIGNHKSVVAVARRRGIDVLQNEVGSRSTPTMVAFQGKQRLIGNEAAQQIMSNSANTINHLKKLIGRPLNDPTLTEERPSYKLAPAPKHPDYVGVQVDYNDSQEVFAPEQIQGALFGKLKQVAEGGLEGVKVTDCVISCPPYWNDQRRRAMLDAANVAGLNVLRLMNETTAVGLNYGILRPLPKDKEVKVLFVDCGHATTNAAVISFTEGKLQVLGTASDYKLGGRDFDEFLVQHFAAYIKTKYNMDVTTDRKAMLKLRKECERVKLNLSANSKVQFNVEYIMNDRDVSGIIERAEFEALLAQALLPRLTALVRDLLAKVNVKKEELHSAEVVGGTIRIPATQRALAEFFGRDLSKTCDGDESVARGCALQCAMISPSFKVKEFEVHDISPYSIALEWGQVTAAGAAMKPEDSTPLFSVNNPVPSVKLISFTDRTEPFQLIARYRDESVLPPGTNPVIGRFIVSGMPNKPAANGKIGKIKVRVKLTLHGILQVSGAQLIEEIEDATPPAAGTGAPAAKTASTEDISMDESGGKAPESKKADEAKMDTTPDAATAGTEPSKEAAAAAAAALSKRVKKTELKVESFYTGGNTADVLSYYYEREVEMANQDRIIFETNQAKNDLESYVLEMRNKISDENELAKYATETEKELLNKMLSETEDWLYGDGYDAQKSEYKKRLESLKAVGDPIYKRKFEREHRGEYANALKQTIGATQRLASSTDEKYAHISAEDRKPILDETNKVDEWLSRTLSELDRQAQHENPKTTIAEFIQKKDALEKFANPIMSKAKPAPPKVASPPPETKQESKESKKETDNTADAKPTENGDAPKMDTTA